MVINYKYFSEEQHQHLNIPPGISSRRYTCPPWLGYLADIPGLDFIHDFCRNKFNAFKVIALAPGESVAALEERVRESEMILAENVVTRLQVRVEEAIERERVR